MGSWLTIELALGVILVTSFTCMGLLALWAATSPRHWFLRSAAVLAVLSPLLLIPAYEPWIALTLQALIVVAGADAWRWHNSRPHRFAFRFSLRALLAAPLLVATTIVIGTRVGANLSPPTAGSWATMGLNGVCSGGAVLLGAWAFASKRKLIAWPAVFALCLALAAIMAWSDWLFLSVTYMRDWPPYAATPAMFAADTYAPYPAVAWFAILPAVTMTTWLMIRMWSSGAAISAVAGDAGRLRQLVTRCVFGLLLVAIAFSPVAIAWRLLYPPPMPSISTPHPNGFFDIMAAGRQFGFRDRMQPPCSTEELAAEIAEYGRAYERLRLGVSRDVQVRVWTKDEAMKFADRWEAGWLFDETMSAAHALIREAELAQQQNRDNDAARIAVECICLAQATTRNGLVVDYQRGLGIEIMGNLMLHHVLSQLNTAECRRTIDALIEIDQQREPVEDVCRRDRIWHENSGDWFEQLVTVLVAVASANDGTKPIAILKRDTETRLLIVELALRAYQVESGKPPDQLKQLTPEFLATLPVDPFDPSSGPLRYIRSGDQSTVYSVGPDGNDDDGRPCPPEKRGRLDPEGDGDLRLDLLFPPDDGTDDAEPKD